MKLSDCFLDLNQGMNSEQKLTDKANELLEKANIKLKNINVNKAKNIAELAIRVNENTFDVLEACHDFISANHWGSMNSNQYNTVVARSQNLEMILKTNSIHSEKSLEAISQLREAVNAYVNYTGIRKRKDSTRMARLDAAKRMNASLIFMEKTAKKVAENSVKLDNINNHVENKEDRPTVLSENRDYEEKSVNNNLL